MARVFDWVAAAFIATPLLLAACTENKPARFYVLTPLDEPAATVGQKGPSLGVGPVVIPQYLDRPEIVTRDSNNQLALAEFDQWGGRIGDNITRVLAENLSGLLKTERISIYPWTDVSSLTDQITVDITKFERDQSGSVTLTAFWNIADAQSGKIIYNGRSSIQKPLAAGTTATAGGYDAIAAAMSEALASLSEEIAAAIRTLPRAS